MAGTLTKAGLAKLAEAQATGTVFNIDKIIFANISGLDPNATPPDTTTKPTADKIVYTAPIVKGYINNDTCNFKASLLPDVGPFSFNWVGLFSTSTNALVAVNYQALQHKTKTTLNETGNIVVKTFSLQYTSLKNLANVTIRADLDSWDVMEILSTKADKNHTHATYAPTSHAHLVSDITYLQLTLDAKAHVSHMHAGLVPEGTIIMGVRSTIPDGFLECNGAELSKAVYANLFNVIGIRFGSSTDGTKFKLPDLRGEFIRGWDNGRGVDASRTLGSFQAASTQLVGHNHIQLGAGEQAFDYLDSAGVPQIAIASGPDVSRSSKTTARWNPLTSTTGNSNETRPRNIAVQFFIKY